jgi:acyl carrier protein
MSDVFISYARSDREKARLLAETLQQEGLSIWWDPQIPPGQTFDAVIEEAIDTAQCVIVLWSKNSVRSDWVKTEAAEGKRRNILIPVLLDEVKIPLEFRRIQTADLMNWKGERTTREYQKLLIAIQAILGKELASTDIQVPDQEKIPGEPDESSKFSEDYIAQRFKVIVAKHFDKNPDTVKNSTSYIDNLGADDLDSIELCMAIEEEFDIGIPDEDWVSLADSTVGRTIEYIVRRLKPAS